MRVSAGTRTVTEPTSWPEPESTARCSIWHSNASDRAGPWQALIQFGGAGLSWAASLAASWAARSAASSSGVQKHG